MTCRRCQGCMARDHFLDLQESGGEWWMEGWRCINCGHVFDPVVEQNRRLQEAGILSARMAAKQPNERRTMSEQQLPLDIAA
jgi:hypothetical protein